MIRLSTTPEVRPPSRWLNFVSSVRTALVVVSVSSIRMSQPPPGSAVAGHQRIRARWARRACRVLLRAASAGPELLDWVKDLPGQLDLLVPGEQRRVADEDVEQQPLVRLRAG